MGTYFSDRKRSLVEGVQQKQVKARLKELADTHGAKQGMDRREFLKTSSGMAAAFLALNSVYGKMFDVSEVEAADASMATERAEALHNQFIFDAQTYLVRDDYDYPLLCSPPSPPPLFPPLEESCERIRKHKRGSSEHSMCVAIEKNKREKAKLEYELEWVKYDNCKKGGFLDFLRQTATALDPNNIDIYLLKFENYVRQIYLNSDTNVAVLSGAPFDDPTWEFLSNAQIAEAAKMVNTVTGHRRTLSDAVVTPGQPGWMEEVDRILAERPPTSWKLYPIGDPRSPKTKYPFWLDDEKLLYPFYEKAVKAGIVNLNIHKGLMPRDYEQSWAGVWEYNTPRDLVKAAADWPELNFIIAHGAFRAWFDKPEEAWGDFERTGRIEWCSDLAEVPAQNGASNIYAAMNTTFASTSIVNPLLAAAILGTWIKGLGVSNVVWGTDSVLYGSSPQWQIEAMRRMEIPEYMQEKYGFTPLGGADSTVKQQIFGLNSARLYNLDLRP